MCKLMIGFVQEEVFMWLRFVQPVWSSQCAIQHGLNRHAKVLAAVTAALVKIWRSVEKNTSFETRAGKQFYFEEPTDHVA